MLREIGVVVLSIHPTSQEDAAILRKPRGVPGHLCLPMCYTPIVLVSHRSLILHYIQSHVTLFILSHCYSITQSCNAVQWHSNGYTRVQLGQGAQGPPTVLRGLRAPHSITPNLSLEFGEGQTSRCCSKLYDLGALHDSGQSPLPQIAAIATAGV